MRLKSLKNRILPIVSDSIISVDRAYIDYNWLYSLKKSRVSFVTIAKSNIKYKVIGQHKVDKTKGLLFDKEIMLTGFYHRRYYPEKLRLIGLKDTGTKKKLIFLTNNFTLSAYTITQIYKARWQIELFFKWIKLIFYSWLLKILANQYVIVIKIRRGTMFLFQSL